MMLPSDDSPRCRLEVLEPASGATETMFLRLREELGRAVGSRETGVRTHHLEYASGFPIRFFLGGVVGALFLAWSLTPMSRVCLASGDLPHG